MTTTTTWDFQEDSTTQEFLAQLQSRDMKVWAEGDRLRCNAPQGALDPVVRQELARRKPEIMAFLHAATTWAVSPSAVVALQPAGSRRPFFGVPGHNGDVFCFVPLARHLGREQPFYALQAPGLDGRREPFDRIEDLAAYFVDQLRAVQPEGPYLLGGYCSGGTQAFEVAQQLRRQGQEVALLALFGSACPTSFHPLYRHLFRRAVDHGRRLAALPPRERARYVGDKARAFLQAVAPHHGVPRDSATARRIQLEAVTAVAIRKYPLRRYPGRIALFLPCDDWRRSGDRPMDWAAFGDGGFDAQSGPDGCDGDVMLREPWVRWFAERLERCLQNADAQLSAKRVA